MHLTRYTDYSLRVLLYLALADRTATVAEIAECYAISRHHLVKVVHELGRRGFVRTERGRGGGVRLARPPAGIGLGEVVREMEPHFHLVECFEPGNGRCRLAPQCALKHALAEAHRAFHDALDRYTLERLAGDRRQLRRLLDMGMPPAGPARRR